jgi:hypothetical protein
MAIAAGFVQSPFLDRAIRSAFGSVVACATLVCSVELLVSALCTPVAPGTVNVAAVTKVALPRKSRRVDFAKCCFGMMFLLLVSNVASLERSRP